MKVYIINITGENKMSNVIDFNSIKAKKNSKELKEVTTEELIEELTEVINFTQIEVAKLLGSLDISMLHGSLALRILSDRIKRDYKYNELGFDQIVDIFVDSSPTPEDGELN